MKKVSEFSVKLKKWRKRRAITQKEAAIKMGISVNTLRGWEQNKHEPSPGFRWAIYETYFKNGNGK